MSSWWVWWVAGCVALFTGLRWALADLLLDWLGSPRTSWADHERRRTPQLQSRRDHYEPRQ